MANSARRHDKSGNIEKTKERQTKNRGNIFCTAYRPPGICGDGGSGSGISRTARKRANPDSLDASDSDVKIFNDAFNVEFLALPSNYNFKW